MTAQQWFDHALHSRLGKFVRQMGEMRLPSQEEALLCLGDVFSRDPPGAVSPCFVLEAGLECKRG